MKRQFILTCICPLFAFVSTQGKTTSTHFAHAYRALGYLRADRKAAIDKDVYHFSRPNDTINRYFNKINLLPITQ